MKQQAYSAALYLRLSRDDVGSGDSGSIQTQQMMLERYCKEQRIHIHDLYIDDGYSGLNFERPAFQRMLADIKRGAVNLVITKDAYVKQKLKEKQRFFWDTPSRVYPPNLATLPAKPHGGWLFHVADPSRILQP